MAAKTASFALLSFFEDLSIACLRLVQVRTEFETGILLSIEIDRSEFVIASAMNS